VAAKALHHDDVPKRIRYVNEIITFMGAEGIVKVPGRRIEIEEDWQPFLHQQPLPTWEEQTLCIGSTFSVAATNGKDPARRVLARVWTSYQRQF